MSNLPCLSKLLEKVAQTQLQRFLTACDKLPIHHSAYRQFHSTETALLKVFNDLLQAADRGQVSSLCLLDLTAAFDTVDHELLVLRLQRSFGIRGIALAWFISYSQPRLKLNTDKTELIWTAPGAIWNEFRVAMCH